MLNIAVAGATGYAGAEALRLLLSHPGYGTDFTIGALTAGSNAGQRFGDLMPQIPQLAERTVQATTPETLEDADAVILALPHGVSAAIASKLPPSTKIIDCGADFRLEDADAWAHYYGTEHAGTWTYGIPELPGNRETIASSTTIAAPGCFPTGATLAAAPGVVAGVIEPELTIVSITGVSGAGKKAAVNLIGAETMGNLRAYGVGTHRHTPEIAQNIRNLLKTASSADTTGQPAHTPEDVRVTFTPVLAPLTRGILTTVTAPLSKHLTELPEQEAADAVRAAYEAFCAPEHFLHLLPAGQQPETKHVQGTNMVHLQVEVVGNAVVVTSAIDNLTKGTAGAAVQCLNLMYGWPEHAGLPQVAL